MASANTKPLGQGPKLLLDLGPLLVFFGINWFFKIYWATGALMATTAAALLVKYRSVGRLSNFDLISAGFLLVFGGAAILLQDQKFLVAKVTLIELLFAALLLVGLFYKKFFLKEMLGEALEMPDVIWRALTIRWAGFFAAMAVLNLLIYWYFPDYWVSFKAFGLMICTILFAFANAPFMARHIKNAP